MKYSNSPIYSTRMVSPPHPKPYVFFFQNKASIFCTVAIQWESILIVRFLGHVSLRHQSLPDDVASGERDASFGWSKIVSKSPRDIEHVKGVFC